MKRLFITLAILFFAVIAFAGINDRFADLELVDVTATAAEINALDGLSGDIITTTSTSTLTNKTLDDATTKFGDTADATKDVFFSLGGATTAKTLTIISSQTDDRSLTLPDATDTLVGKATTDVLTNKTLTSPVLNTGVSGTAVLDDDTMGTATATTVGSTESIKAYIDSMRKYVIQLASVFVDSVGPITAASAPNLATTDNIAAITYDSSAEVAEIQFTHAPTTNFAGLTIKVAATSSVADGTEQAVDWSIFVNDPDVGIPTVIAQTGATFDSATMDASLDEVTLTLDATGISAITGGTGIVHIAIWNNGTSDGTLEIKGITVDEL